MLLWLAWATGCGVDVYEAGGVDARELAAKPGERVIAFAGDVMTWDRAAPYIEREGSDYPFRATAALFRAADLAVANLEGPVAKKAERVARGWSYRVPPSALAGLKGAGFDVVSVANNHAFDCGEAGLVETMEWLRDAGIAWFGGGRDEAAAVSPHVARLGDARVAFLGFVAAETYFGVEGHGPEQAVTAAEQRRMESMFRARSGRAGVAVADPAGVAEAVRRAEQSADAVVVFIHFGVRYLREPTRFQRSLAHAAVDAGADLVVGHHAHFWQPVEVYRGVPIAYGIGNFAFGSGNSRADEALVVRAVFLGRRLAALVLHPLYIKNRDSLVAYQPKLMRGRSAQSMLDRLAAASAGFGARIAVERGQGVIRLARSEKNSQ